MQGKKTYKMHKVKKHWVSIAGTATVLSVALLTNNQAKADEQTGSAVVRADSAAVVTRPADAGQTSQVEQTTTATAEQTATANQNQQASANTANQVQEQRQDTANQDKWQAVDQASQPEQVATAVNQAQKASESDANQVVSRDVKDSHAVVSKDDAKASSVQAASQAGFYTTGNNDWYYKNEDGSLAKGLQTINGQTLYFDNNTGKQVKGATATIDGKEYYFDQDTGDMWKDRFRQIDKQDYRGVAPGSKVGVAWLYYQADGSVASGLTTTPDGRTLMFNTYNHEQVKGKLVNTDGSNYRYFDLHTGDMLRNTSIYDGSQKYNIDDNGIATKA